MASKTTEELPSQMVPYPTGNPPDPTEALYIAHPELKPKDEPEPEPEANRKGRK
jgi:hypothetical protein